MSTFWFSGGRATSTRPRVPLCCKMITTGHSSRRPFKTMLDKGMWNKTNKVGKCSELANTPYQSSWGCVSPTCSWNMSKNREPWATSGLAPHLCGWKCMRPATSRVQPWLGQVCRWKLSLFSSNLFIVEWSFLIHLANSYQSNQPHVFNPISLIFNCFQVFSFGFICSARPRCLSHKASLLCSCWQLEHCDDESWFSVMCCNGNSNGTPPAAKWRCFLAHDINYIGIPGCY